MGIFGRGFLLRGLAAVALVAFVAVVFASPLLALWLHPAGAEDARLWMHFREYVLGDAAWNTVRLGVQVALGAGIVGTALAWAVALLPWRWRVVWHGLVLLPFVIPPYVGAFVFLGLWDWSGSVQSTLRARMHHFCRHGPVQRRRYPFKGIA